MIYELRAYIGKTKTLYTAIFTTMEAAKADANRLRKNTALNEIEMHGTITPLQPVNGKFEPIFSGCEYL